MEETRRRAIDLILERGVQFRLPAPLLCRMVGVRSIALTLRSLYLGTILEIGRLTDRADEPEVQAEIIALAVLNGRLRIRLLRRPLTRYLLRQVRSDSLVELMGVVMTLTRQSDFMLFTTWATQLAATVVEPAEDESEGSHESVDSIAPSASSDT